MQTIHYTREQVEDLVVRALSEGMTVRAIRWAEDGSIAVDRDPLNADQLLVNGFPRRARVDLFSQAEKAIYDATHAVEAAGAHTLLTEAVVLLGKARDKVADFVELPK